LADEAHLRDWERLYSHSRHLSIWPWSDLVSLTMRFARPRPGSRVLELGCGAGANIPFFQSLGVEYWAIEASPTIVDRLRKNYPELEGRLIVGDFATDISAPGHFDLVIDRGSITHNPTSSIRNIVVGIRDRLSPGGMMLGVDWFSTASSDYKLGSAGEDIFTRAAFEKGRLAGTGLAHFCDEAHLRELLAGFQLVHLDHKLIEQREPADGTTFASWNFVAKAT
jgi:SAM-dependent methyltransferase